VSDPERDLSLLETLMRRLEKEYEQFFAGQLRREPSETEGQVLAIIRTWSRGAIQNSTLAFRYNTAVARYNSFRSVWSRRMREREEGRTIAAPARGGRAAPPPPRRAPEPEPGAASSQYVAVDPARESRRLGGLYETYRRLREESGESVDRLRPESFQKALAERVSKIKEQYRCEAVLIRVVAEGGRTRIVAKPCRRSPKADPGE